MGMYKVLKWHKVSRTFLGGIPAGVMTITVEILGLESGGSSDY